MVNVPLLYFLRTSENPRFSDIFKVYRSRTLVENRLISEKKMATIPKPLLLELMKLLQ